MAGSFVVMEKIDDREILRVLKRLADKGGNLRPAFANMGEYLVNSTQDRFDEQKDPEGNPWSPLKPATKDKKKIDKILTESSRMRNSVIYAASSSSLRVGTNDIKAAAHQFGLKEAVTIPAHKSRRTKVFGRELPFPVWAEVRAHTINQDLPARPFLGFSSDDREELLQIAADFLAK
ncbi:MAG: phage virion morphogenesis protein [Pseudomonadota bacterium]